MQAEKPKPPPEVAAPVSLEDETVKSRQKSAFRKAGNTSRSSTNILKGGGSYGSGKQTLG